jgi:hypothetical protein
MSAAPVLELTRRRAGVKVIARRRAETRSAASVVRTELLSNFLEHMNAALLPYCVLSGLEGYPEAIDSDVDFMVRPADAERVAPLLMAAAGGCGARLVQAIQHETGAWYFVLAKQKDGEVGYLHPDCSTDYRREGRLWLAAGPALAGRKRDREFFVPAVGDEFAYYLIKKILKQSITGEQLQRLAALHARCPEECRARLRRFWPERTLEAMAEAIVRRDVGWMRFYLRALLSDLRASVPLEGRWERSKQWLRELRRRAGRVVNPTGLSVAVYGGTAQQRKELAVALENNLRPAFRRTRIVGEGEPGGGISQAISAWMAKVRSTLVIRQQEKCVVGWLARNEIRFVIAGAVTGKAMRGRWVRLDGSQSLQNNLEYATQVSLEWMAERLRRRMKGPLAAMQVMTEVAGGAE